LENVRWDIAVSLLVLAAAINRTVLLLKPPKVTVICITAIPPTDTSVRWSVTVTAVTLQRHKVSDSILTLGGSLPLTGVCSLFSEKSYSPGGPNSNLTH
jgi:hypothetical protein